MSKIIRSLIITIVLIYLSAACFGQSKDTDKSPQKIVLDNGLTIVIKQEPGSNLVAVTCMVKVGAAEETIMNAGIGNFVSHLLLASTSVSSADKIAAIADSVGGNLRSQWNPDYSQLSAVTTSAMFSDTISLMAECLMQADFDKSWVEKTRSELLRSMRSESNPPFDLAYSKLRELLYEDNGYRRSPYGIERVVRTLSAEDLRKFHSAYYVPNNTVVAIAGDVTPEYAVERVKLAFSGWVPRELPKRLPIPDETIDMFRSYASEADIDLAYVLMGWLAPSVKSEDFAAVSVAGSALGGGKGSLMFQQLRQELGMGYEIGTAYPRLRNQSHLMAYVATDPFKFSMETGGPNVVLDEIKTNILKMVNELKNQPLDDSQLRRAKGFAIGQFAHSHQHLTERANDLAWFETVGVGYDMYQRLPDDIEKVTAEDVQRVAKKYLDKYALVLLLPKGQSGQKP